MDCIVFKDSPQLSFLKVLYDTCIKAVNLCCSLGPNLYALPVMLGVKLTALLKTAELNKDSCLIRKSFLLSEKMSQGITEDRTRSLLKVLL